MCEAGRIRHHLKHNLWKSANIILFVGYQAEGSLGRRILSGEKFVNLFGEEISVNAEICSLHGTSGHADRDGLFAWLRGYDSKPEIVFINHGSDESTIAFKEFLTENGYRAEAPYSGTEYDLIAGRMTVYTEGKHVDRTKVFKGNTRAEIIYHEMVIEAEKLLELVKRRRGKTNKDNARLTSQLRELRDKWRY